ncbi:subtilisin-like protease [Acrasis kona]|uniref:Subtilisin-like protease n=1 Tax=Acrasis kona TaxID=1008807 RepID=A0AAW2ZN47_9EUKA
MVGKMFTLSCDVIRDVISEYLMTEEVVVLSATCRTLYATFQEHYRRKCSSLFDMEKFGDEKSFAHWYWFLTRTLRFNAFYKQGSHLGSVLFKDNFRYVEIFGKRGIWRTFKVEHPLAPLDNFSIRYEWDIKIIYLDRLDRTVWKMIVGVEDKHAEDDHTCELGTNTKGGYGYILGTGGKENGGSNGMRYSQKVASISYVTVKLLFTREGKGLLSFAVNGVDLGVAFDNLERTPMYPFVSSFGRTKFSISEKRTIIQNP